VGDVAGEPGGPPSRPAGLGLESPMRAVDFGRRGSLAGTVGREPARWRSAFGAGVVAVLVGGLATLLVVTAAAPASAHTRLLSSTPANGATVPTAPATIQLLFAQRLLGLGAVAVDGPGGVGVAAGEAVLAGATVTQALVANRPAGSYRLAYRIVSADGHPVAGEITFTATAGTGAPSTAPSATGAGPTPTVVVDPTGGAAGRASAAAGGDDGGWSTGLIVGVAVGGGVLATLGGAAAALAFRRRQGSTDGT